MAQLRRQAGFAIRTETGFMRATRLQKIGRAEILSGVSHQGAIARMINSFHPGNDVHQPGIMMVDMFHKFGFRIRRTGDENGTSVSDRTR